ncbi:MAG TPA: pyridoxamine 5'-phosphate oxidase family protein [Candidatus Sulfotelmatobacter sp.]|nr:pyridoxamine 5'-phosphate oxidase family protein [Candidatus Sulfotelmatobacter sp.]
MGKPYPELDEALRQFIQAQSVFFIATAPLDPNGHVNLSPKGLDTFRILGPRTVAYLDLVGSGVETISHVKENGRIVIMFCAFEGPPKVLRLHGRARVILPADAEFPEFARQFPAYDGVRGIIIAELTRINDSCGYGVPLLKHESERPQLPAWIDRKGPDGLKQYQRDKNAKSLDGLPGV